MPLKWQRNLNPYVHSYFGRLRIGPNVSAVQITEQAKKLDQKIKMGARIELAGVALDVHMVSEASSRLRKPKALAEELLLVHSQPQGADRKLKTLCNDVRKLAVAPDDPVRLPLVHPLAVFWFTPEPSAEAAEMPAWEEFKLVEPGDPADLELDIVFDTF